MKYSSPSVFRMLVQSERPRLFEAGDVPVVADDDRQGSLAASKRECFTSTSACLVDLSADLLSGVEPRGIDTRGAASWSTGARTGGPASLQ